MTYMEIWNRILWLTKHDPENEEIQVLLARLDELDESEKGVTDISPRATGQRRPRS